jgi:hypothetical protein
MIMRHQLPPESGKPIQSRAWPMSARIAFGCPFYHVRAGENDEGYIRG